MNEVSPTIYKHIHKDVRLQCALELGQDICIQSATSHRRRVQCTGYAMQESISCTAYYGVLAWWRITATNRTRC